MRRAPRILLVEDSEDDTILIIRELERAGYRPEFQRVETAAAMDAALAEDWDVVLADYVLPRFSALAALVLLKKRGLKLPFIIVSGAISEGIAIAAMKAGADDYVMKGNIGRLGAVLDRVVSEVGEIRPRGGQIAAKPLYPSR